METPQPPQVSVSGSIVIEGHLTAPNSPSVESAPLIPPRRWWQFWMPVAPEFALARATIWLVIATLLLAAIAFGQALILATTDISTRKVAQAAQDAVKLARENFIVEQRPIIWLAGITKQPSFVVPAAESKSTANPASPNVGPMGCAAWDWYYTNYGKTPAIKISYEDFMTIKGKTEPNLEKSHIAAPVPTNKVDFNTILSQEQMTQEQFTELLKMPNGIGISAKIKYEDAYGNKYQTDFCMYLLRTGAVAYCDQGNEIK